MWCSRKLNHVSITQGFCIAKPCCIFDDNFARTDIDNDIRTLYSFNDNVNSNFRSEIINTDTGCEKCVKTEENNEKSLRYYTNSVNKNPTKNLEELEIALDFKCNMRCLTCRPGCSSKWNLSQDIIEKLMSLDHNTYNNDMVKDHKKYEKILLKLFTKSDLSHLKRIKFVGGEPFLSKNLKTVLNLLPPVEVSFSTNGSIRPNLDIFKRHKHLVIDVSLDAVDNLANVMRYGVDFETIKGNVDYFLNNDVDVKICCTVSILNANKMRPLIDFAHERNLIINYIPVYDPYFLSIFQFDKSVRESWKIGVENFDNLLSTNIKIDKAPEKALEFIELMDDVNNTRFRSVNPEILKLLEDANAS